VATLRNLVCVSATLIVKIRVLATVMWKIGYRIIVVIISTAAAAAVFCLLFLPLNNLK